MNIHHSEVKRFSDLKEINQSDIYSYFESMRFKEIQNLLAEYKEKSLHERINSKGMFKGLSRQVSNFHRTIINDCNSNIYLGSGYILNRCKINLVRWLTI